MFGSGFTFFSTLMAQIYVMAGLLPANHPYLNPQNSGRFGIHHVIAEAANNLKLNRQNLDKIFIFIALLVGAILLVLQFAFMIGMFFINTAWAIPIADLFDTLNPQTDIAYNLLTLVFGVPDVYCSSSAPGTCSDSNALVPFPIHTGLHELFRFYSFGLLLIGVLIFLYYVVVVVAETATTGSPFGRRFQNVWVPVRLVVALGLLVPINYGLNSGQYLTLYAAKLGSSLATSGWLRYNNTIEAHSLFGGPGNGANPIGERETLIALPKRPSIAPVMQAMSLIHTCAYSYWASEGEQPEGPARPFASGHYHYSDFDGGTPAPGAGPDPIKIRAWFVKTSPNGMAAPGPQTRYELLPTTSIQEALNFYGNGDITIRFGERKTGPNAHLETGEVKPYCGDITIPVISVQGRDAINIADPDSSAAMIMLYTYYRTVRDTWFRLSSTASDNLRRGAIFFNENVNNQQGNIVRTCDPGEACGPAGSGLPSCMFATRSGVDECVSLLPEKEWSSDIVNDVHSMIVDPALVSAWQFYIQNAGIEIEDEILLRGWAGAGMWFNRLAHLNGSFQDSVTALPQMSKFPLVMEHVREDVKKENPGVSGTEMFKPRLSRGRPVAIGTDADTSRASAMYETYKLWNDDGGADGDPEKELLYNAFMDTMNMIMGTDAVFDIRGANVSTHPLVQLIMIGKGMVESTIRNLGVAAGTSFMGGLAGAGSKANSFFSGVSGIMSTTAFIGLTAGIVLFYVLPFLPFVYFFFAVGSWVKSIFEAMVGVPLWALAHLRLDGEGLPGDSASNGYFLLLEIGIRPILTVFGLVAALLIFTAQVRVLHFIWDLVVENSAGYSDTNIIPLDASYHDDMVSTTPRDAYKRGIVDQFFFTIIYTIIVYMLATASFKLIDSIPDNILRWGGIGVSAFGDQNQDPLDGLQRYVAMGGMIQGQQLTEGAIGAFGGTGNAVRMGMMGGRAGAAAGRGGP